MVSEDISKNIYRGVKWTSVQQWTFFIVNALTMVILANLLLPKDFGIFIEANIIISFIIVFQELGINSVIIRRENLEKHVINSFFSILIGLTILLSIIIYLIAPAYVSFFHTGTGSSVEKIYIVRGLILVILLSNIFAIPRTLMQRELQFKELSKNMIIGLIVGSVLSILAALKIGVWALVIKQITTTFITGLLNWRYISFNVNFSFDMKYIREEWGYIKGIFGSQLLNYFTRNIDYLIIGKYLGENALGQYSVAYKLMVFPIKNFAGIMARILFPILKKLMPDYKLVTEQYFESIRLISFLTFPIMFFIAATSDSIVRLFFNEKIWDQLPTMIMLLAILGAFQSTTSSVGVLYKLQKNTSILLFNTMLGVLIISSAYLIGVQWGLIEAIILHSILWLIIIFPVSNIMIFKRMDAYFIDFLKLLTLPVFSSLILFILLRFSIEIIWYNLTVVGFIGTFCISILFYSLFLKMFKVNIYDTIKLILRA